MRASVFNRIIQITFTIYPSDDRFLQITEIAFCDLRTLTFSEVSHLAVDRILSSFPCKMNSLPANIGHLHIYGVAAVIGKCAEFNSGRYLLATQGYLLISALSGAAHL